MYVFYSRLNYIFINYYYYLLMIFNQNLILHFVLFICIHSQVSVPYFLENEKYNIEIDIGNPLKLIHKPIDQMLSNSLFISGNYQPDSFTIKNHGTTTLYIKDKKIDCDILSDSVTLIMNKEKDEKVTVDDFTFYFSSFLEFIGVIVREGFAFSYNMTNYNNSLTHLLYINHKIDHLLYAFYPQTNTTGTLYFGNVPSSITKNYQYESSCSIIPNGIYWGCSIDKIEFGNLEYIPVNNETHSNHVYFNSGFNNIHFPEDFIDYFSDYLYIFGRCSVFSSIEGIDVTCDKTVMAMAGNITFTIGDYQYVIDIPSLFKCSTHNCYSLFMTKKEYGNNWVFGIQFLNRFISVFDYENKEIRFMSAKHNIVYTSSYYTKIRRAIIKGIFVFLILLMGIFIFRFIFKLKDY